MYKLNEEKMFYDIADGQAVVINLVTGMYYGTSMLGSAVLDRLVHGNAPEQILNAVRVLPGCPEDFGSQMDEFVRQLVEKEILLPGSETRPGGDEVIDEGVLEDGFFLNLDEFSEVQDLILADPIHDVDVEQGWPVFKDE